MPALWIVISVHDFQFWYNYNKKTFDLDQGVFFLRGHDRPYVVFFDDGTPMERADFTTDITHIDLTKADFTNDTNLPADLHLVCLTKRMIMSFP